MLIFLCVYVLYRHSVAVRVIMMMVAMSMVVVVMRVTMTVIVTSTAARAVVMRAVTTVRLEDTSHIIENAVAMATRAAAVSNDNEVNDVTDERDNRGNKHDLRVEVNGLVMDALVNAHDGFNDQPSDKDPNDEDGGHGTKHLSAVEAERVPLVG